MKPLSQRRKAVMDVLLGTMKRLDPSGLNAKKYKEMFDKMSDKEFEKWADDFFNDESKNLYLEIEEFDREVNLDEIEAAASFLGIPLYERVASPHLTGKSDDAIVTPQPVPVGYCHVKKMQQFILKKNSGSIHVNKRNSKTGQVIGDDKNGRNSDAETYALLNIGAEHALKEFMGPRADDPVMQAQMMNAIQMNGFVTEEDMTSDPENKVSLATMDAYFTLQGLRTNVYTPIDEIPKPKLR